MILSLPARAFAGAGTLDRWCGNGCHHCAAARPRATRRACCACSFEAYERRFVAQVRLSILLAGLSGFYMLNKMQAWERLLDPAFWWLMLMVAVWAVFALMVFVLEPLVVHRLFHNYALRDKERAFALAIWLHAVALTVAVVAIAAGVLGIHGA